MNRVIPRIKLVFTKYPIVRGMVSYAIVWPIGNLAQQSIAGKRWDTYDWGKCLRFSLYGSFFVAPTLYTWIRVAGAMWPSTSFKTGLAKALTEQIAYTPGAMTCFYFIMSLLEFKTVHEAAHEVSTKFLPTYKVCLFKNIGFKIILCWDFLSRLQFVSGQYYKQ